MTAPGLALPTVTLCAATSVNLAATVEALNHCLAQVRVAECILFTSEAVEIDNPLIRVVRIDPLRSSDAYSAFMLERLVDHIRSDHVLVVQWDGFILDAQCWNDEFLDYDYIGAPWPQFADGNDVGNGGFSLRSRRLLEACRDLGVHAVGAEDVTICRFRRSDLERERGIRFAPLHVAERFAFERTRPRGPTFGFHGVFNMIPLLGSDGFWSIYQHLDERSSVKVDFRLLLRQLGGSPGAAGRRWRLTVDRLRASSGR